MKTDAGILMVALELRILAFQSHRHGTEAGNVLLSADRLNRAAEALEGMVEGAAGTRRRPLRSNA